jgi:hypothetical protein
MMAAPHGSWLTGAQILLLNAGFLGSLWLLWKKNNSRPAFAFVPWAAVALMGYLLGVWICTQPMEMRGAFS